MDVVFLVDGSDNMGKVEYTKAMDFIINYVKSLAIGPKDVRVAIAVFYGNNLWGQTKLNEHQSYESVVGVASQLKFKFPGGEQNLVMALDKLHNDIFVTENGAREDTPHILFFLTNGKIQASRTEIAVEVGEVRFFDA
jgi:predicted ATPase